MTDVFISYSRKDKAFVQVLNQALVESQYDAWVDWEDIPPAANWWQEIERGIEAANTFIFVISPDAISSRICSDEIAHAARCCKRMIPIVYRDGFDTDKAHSAVNEYNWLFFSRR